MVEVQFKNTRKGYYKNSNKLKLGKGDIVAVDSSEAGRTKQVCRDIDGVGRQLSQSL